ncbi:MAG: protein-L-isoaspartate(D-aspartate) O-methyltransferase [Bacteroidetes bacterium]|nr:protein-L-isoaspartate(D-aspartate) O-methyltransferase [Bacteroidota bacterium]
MTPNQLTDTYLHQGLRSKLVKELREKGIKDENILHAIGKIPRHFFFNTTFIKFAYEDKAFPIAAGQTISQPYTVAFQTQLLELKKGEKVMEIGTGSGYQTAVLLEMGVKVFTIERQKELYDKTKISLPAMGYAPKFFYGDGYIGLEAFAPFDKILVTAGAPFIPEPLKQQLKTGGRLVIPVGQGDLQEMILIEKKSPTPALPVREGEKDSEGAFEYKQTKHGFFRFVPLLEEKNK